MFHDLTLQSRRNNLHRVRLPRDNKSWVVYGMKKIFIYASNMFMVLLLTFTNYFYTVRFIHHLWPLIIIPIILLVFIYPKWKVAIVSGIFMSGFKFSIMLAKNDWTMAHAAWIEMVIAALVNWTLLISFTYLVIKTSKVEKKLQHSSDKLNNQNAFLEAILHNMGEVVVACDSDGRIHYSNDAASHMKNLEGISPSQWSQYFNFYAKDGVTVIPV